MILNSPGKQERQPTVSKYGVKILVTKNKERENNNGT